MKTVRLGKTGLVVSRIGIGGIPLQRPAEEEAIEVVRRALDLGINWIDTARDYGISEERIGKAIAGHRDRVVIATKGWGDKARASQCIQESLERLNTGYIDLWQFHGINTFQEYDQVLGPGGAMEAAQQALRAGQIRHVGISSHNMDVALKAVTSGLFETLQFPFNFVNNEAADKLVSLAHEHDVGFIAMKPFAGGRLTDARLALKYLLQFDTVVPDPGVEKVEEIQEIVAVVNSEAGKLTSEEWQKIESVRAELGTRFCQWCGYCMPCAQGVQSIPSLMNVRVSWRLWPRELFLSRLAGIVESWQNCIQCGECESKCPYQLPIREMIPKSIEFYASVKQ